MEGGTTDVGEDDLAVVNRGGVGEVDLAVRIVDGDGEARFREDETGRDALREIVGVAVDELEDQDKPSSSIAGAGERKVAEGDGLPFAGAGEKKRSPSSPDDRLEKRARFHHRGDGKNLEEMFAGRWMVCDGVRRGDGMLMILKGTR
uniref:Uncharacterized protein n=1 Tax=Oryza punctata TaxID=4537 RepID=A0A0E0KF50_ORYPU